MRIGLLRSLLYYPLGPFWKAFFQELGCEVEVSPPMSSGVFDRTRKQYCGDICLPVESAFILAEGMRDRVDYIFMPRVNRLHKDIYVCPACAGMPDLLRNVLQLSNILSLNLTPFCGFQRSDRRTLRHLGFKGRTTRRAYRNACSVYNEFVERSRDNPFLDETVEEEESIVNSRGRYGDPDGPRILLLGMPYVLADRFINKNITELLIRKNCRVTTPFMTAPEMISREYRFEGYYMYWTLGGMSIASLMRRHNNIDGVIYCSSFACGVDSAITPIVQSTSRRIYDIPYLLLIVDQHSETTHLEVRIEAFLDSINEVTKTLKENLA